MMMVEDEVDLKKQEEEAMQRFFLNAEGKPFDPVKKFGSIEGGNQLIYSDITTSYALNLPADYYLKMIRNNLPSTESGDNKWFIRPHHVGSLTSHKSSIRDDYLNTHYFSHYNQQYGKVAEEDHNQLAIEHCEKMITEMKLRVEVEYKRKTGKDIDDIYEELIP